MNSVFTSKTEFSMWNNIQRSQLPSSAYLGVALVCAYAKVSWAPLKPAYNTQLQCATSCSVLHVDLRARLWGSMFGEMVGHKGPFRLVVTVIPAVLLPPEWCLVAHLSNVLNTQNQMYQVQTPISAHQLRHTPLSSTAQHSKPLKADVPC